MKYRNIKYKGFWSKFDEIGDFRNFSVQLGQNLVKFGDFVIFVISDGRTDIKYKIHKI